MPATVAPAGGGSTPEPKWDGVAELGGKLYCAPFDCEEVLVVEAPGPNIADHLKLDYRNLRGGLLLTPLWTSVHSGRTLNGGRESGSPAEATAWSRSDI